MSTCAYDGHTYPAGARCPNCGADNPKPQSTAARMSAGGSLARPAQQLDLEGGFHDLAPQTERMRLFDPAPRQIEGQAGLDLE